MSARSGDNRMENYMTVAERIIEFKKQYPHGVLRPLNPEKPWELINTDKGQIVSYTAAAYRTPDDPCPAVGNATEPYPGLSNFTRNSEVMNAETSAWGRALVALDILADRAIASKNEVQNRANEGKALVTRAKAELRAVMADLGIPVDKAISEFESTYGADLRTTDDYHAVEALTAIYRKEK